MLLSKIDYKNIHPLLIDNKDKFYKELIENDYMLLEKFILNNNVMMTHYSIMLLEEKKDNNYLRLFEPGFFRDDDNIKRQIPCYLLVFTGEETRKLLLTLYYTRNICTIYWNDDLLD